MYIKLSSFYFICLINFITYSISNYLFYDKNNWNDEGVKTSISAMRGSFTWSQNAEILIKITTVFINNVGLILLHWGKATVAYAEPQQQRNEESESLRG